MVITFRLSQIHQVVAQVWELHKDKKIWAFYGKMGAGKTTFIHALCSYLHVAGNVSSPTFAIVNEYEGVSTGIIYHMDWYRIKNEEEAIQTGIEDYLISGHYCWVEWPEKAPSILPSNTLRLEIETINADTRKLTMKYEV